MAESRFKIFVGHFGSGKTELALNAALRECGSIIVDMDTVNPYFRANDAKAALEAARVRIIAPDYANTNVDMPTLPAEVFAAFESDAPLVVFDVGGDEDGAYALGGFLRYFKREPYDMYLVANARRPLTMTAQEICAYAKEIETASRLRLTGIVNNTNLGAETTREIIDEGEKIVRGAAKMLGIPFAFTAAKEDLAKDNEMKIKIQLNNPYY